MRQPDGHCAWCGQALPPAGQAQEEAWLCPECEAQFDADTALGLPPGPREPYAD